MEQFYLCFHVRSYGDNTSLRVLIMGTNVITFSRYNTPEKMSILPATQIGVSASQQRHHLCHRDNEIDIKIKTEKNLFLAAYNRAR